MRLAMIGLGRMGGNMVERLLKGGHELVVYDRDPDVVKRYGGMGATGVGDVTELAGALPSPRVLWVMVPAGAPVDETITKLLPGLAPGDVVIDGGNSNFKDTMRRAALLRERGIEFVDAGT